MIKSYDAWMRTGFDFWMLGAEASIVMTMRMARLASGGTDANAEAKLMVNEKIRAMIELQTKMMAGSLGSTPLSDTRGALKHYRSKVSANNKRDMTHVVQSPSLTISTSTCVDWVRMFRLLHWRNFDRPQRSISSRQASPLGATWLLCHRLPPHSATRASHPIFPTSAPCARHILRSTTLPSANMRSMS